MAATTAVVQSARTQDKAFDSTNNVQSNSLECVRWHRDDNIANDWPKTWLHYFRANEHNETAMLVPSNCWPNQGCYDRHSECQVLRWPVASLPEPIEQGML